MSALERLKHPRSLAALSLATLTLAGCSGKETQTTTTDKQTTPAPPTETARPVTPVAPEPSTPTTPGKTDIPTPPSILKTAESMGTQCDPYLSSVAKINTIYSFETFNCQGDTGLALVYNEKNGEPGNRVMDVSGMPPAKKDYELKMVDQKNKFSGSIVFDVDDKGAITNIRTKKECRTVPYQTIKIDKHVSAEAFKCDVQKDGKKEDRRLVILVENDKRGKPSKDAKAVLMTGYFPPNEREKDFTLRVTSLTEGNITVDVKMNKHGKIQAKKVSMSSGKSN